MLPLLPRTGLALDVAAGRGRHSLVLADAGLTVVAVDYSQEAMANLRMLVRARTAAIWPVIADLDSFCLADSTFDLIVNVNFLDRTLFPKFFRALKPGGMLVAETFLIDQATIGHPRERRFLLDHYELRDLVGGLELLRYQEGLRVYPDGTRAWRASALARKERP
jgi:tellurite methyltransferase